MIGYFVVGCVLITYVLLLPFIAVVSLITRTIRMIGRQLWELYKELCWASEPKVGEPRQPGERWCEMCQDWRGVITSGSELDRCPACDWQWEDADDKS